MDDHRNRQPGKGEQESVLNKRHNCKSRGPGFYLGLQPEIESRATLFSLF
jgi:hypothetical protein